MRQMVLPLPRKNDCQRSINGNRHCIIENSDGLARALTQNQTIARISRQNMVMTTSGQCPKHERQQGINDHWSCIMKMQGLHGDFELLSDYRLPFYTKMGSSTSCNGTAARYVSRAG
jgi:hypothetical protein